VHSNEFDPKKRSDSPAVKSSLIFGPILIKYSIEVSVIEFAAMASSIAEVADGIT
jgi:hypothetical protein